MSVLALATVGAWFARKPQVKPPASPTPAPAAAPQSEARALLDRAIKFAKQDGGSRENLEIAEGLIDKARQLDPLDGEVEALAALLDAQMVYMKLDAGGARREKAQREAARAMTLAPASFRARWSRAVVLGNVVGTPAAISESIQIFKALVAEIPEDWRHQSEEQRILQSDFGTLLRDDGRYAEAAAIFQRNHDRISEGWCYFVEGRTAEARRLAHELVAEERTVNRLVLLGSVQVLLEEDLDAAKATADRFTSSELQGEQPAALAIMVAYGQRDADRLLQLAQAFPRDMIETIALVAAKSDLVGEAHALAGRSEAARVEWRRALQVYERRLEASPNDASLHYNRAGVLLELGEDAEAERAARLSWSLSGRNFDQLDFDPLQIVLFWRLRRQEAVLDFLAGLPQKDPADWHHRHADLRFFPFFDVLRGNPRFQKILRDNLPPGAKPLPPPVS